MNNKNCKIIAYLIIIQMIALETVNSMIKSRPSVTDPQKETIVSTETSIL